MAQQARVKKRPARAPAVAPAVPIAARIPWGRLGVDALSFVLLALALTSLLASIQAEGAIAGPLGRFLGLTFGWFAPAAALWLGAIGLMLIAQRIAPRPWPVKRIAATAAASLAILGLAALEARRRGSFEMVPGGGIVGRAIAESLISWFGGASTIGILLLVLIPSLFIATQLSPILTARWVVASAMRGWALCVAARSRVKRPELVINAHEQPVEQLERKARNKPQEEPPVEIVEQDTAPVPVVDAPISRSEPTLWKLPAVTMFQAKRAVERPVSELRDQARIIEETLASFNIEARVIEANQGPVVTQFGLEPAIGVPVSRIMARLNDLALRLGAASVRIEAPVPGRRMMGIEVPNQTTSLVTLREVIDSTASERAKSRIPLALGKEIAGKPLIGDLARMPHLLIAGATGSGKSVCINTIVASMLMHFTPDELQVLMIDPKMVELIAYNGVPHLRMPVVTEMDKVVGTLKWVIREMERRYKLFAELSVRNIDGYNRMVESRAATTKLEAAPWEEPDEAEQLKPMPYMVLIIDELADLMMTAPEEAEKSICRLAQLARATGIHLIIATQRPSVDVLTGLIKANFPTRIAFAVTSQVDSRVILDGVGAERLLGRGDMLYQPPDASRPIRAQGTYVSDSEIETLVEHWKSLGAPQYDDQDLEEIEALGNPVETVSDDMFDRAVDLAHETRRVSASLLQRRLGIGYPRAARLLDLLEEHGIIESSEDGRSWRVVDDDD
jgi:S-DNA-T family DNA segregation ATPase FtsK/SpoIIIE